MIQVLLIEHDEVEHLYPFSITHCAWELRVGRFTIVERWANALVDSIVTVASHRDLHVRSFVERHPNAAAPFRPLPTMLIGAHVVLAPDTMRTLEDACKRSEDPILLFVDDVPVGAFLPEPPDSPVHAQALLEALNPDTCRAVDVSAYMITRLWQCLDNITEGTMWDSDVLIEGDDAVVHMTVAIDEEDGPVLIEDGVVIEPHVFLKGPVVIGSGTIVKSGTRISNSIIGPHCRVAGEIDTSIIQGYTNKSHDGYLGHSYLGEWVNLGAGTTTSNLKSTYGSIRVHMPWGIEDTGQIFLGLLIGDHSKSAIGTHFPTGATCGAACNVVSDHTVSVSIPSFTWLQGSISNTYDVDKMLDVARIVMQRRGKELGPQTEQLLRSIHSARK
ncbi:MAG: putative sugar nucleotidyl transferase [bacterium]|nr:putative sugar nucleotidyl transferase [bacterium]